MADFNHRHVLATLPIPALQGPPSMQRDSVSDSSRARLVNIFLLLRRTVAGEAEPGGLVGAGSSDSDDDTSTTEAASDAAFSLSDSDGGGGGGGGPRGWPADDVSPGQPRPSDAAVAASRQCETFRLSSIQSLTPRRRVLQHDSTLQLQSLLPRPAQFVHPTTCSQATPNGARATAVGSSLAMHSCRSFSAFHARCHNR